MKLGIQLITKYKELFLYGFSMAMVLFMLQLLEAHFIVYSLQLDLFVGAIAILFMMLGVWLTLKLVKPKVEILVVEKEGYKDYQGVSEVDQTEILKSGLSKRELDVLNLMATGLSNDEIAAQLFISLNTVKTHSSNIFLKLEVKRRTQAVEKAKRLNIIC